MYSELRRRFRMAKVLFYVNNIIYSNHIFINKNYLVCLIFTMILIYINSEISQLFHLLESLCNCLF